MTRSLAATMRRGRATPTARAFVALLPSAAENLTARGGSARERLLRYRAMHDRGAGAAARHPRPPAARQVRLHRR
jgi:hypothetical protein